jgi:hypothetical protein
MVDFLYYEQEASNLFIFNFDREKQKQLLNIRISNSNKLIDRVQNNLKVIQGSYGSEESMGILRLYDQAKEILRTIIKTMEANIKIYNSIK